MLAALYSLQMPPTHCVLPPAGASESGVLGCRSRCSSPLSPPSLNMLLKYLDQHKSPTPAMITPPANPETMPMPSPFTKSSLQDCSPSNRVWAAACTNVDSATVATTKAMQKYFPVNFTAILSQFVLSNDIVQTRIHLEYSWPPCYQVAVTSGALFAHVTMRIQNLRNYL